MINTLNELAIENKKPILGICVGLQMFADISYEEIETKGLGWISGKVSKIDNKSGKFKLPHIGWNEINIKKDSKIFKDIDDKSHMYFVHSYEFVPEDKAVISATTDYSTNVVCAVEKENIFGTQFHPEKSDKIGLQIIKKFYRTPNMKKILISLAIIFLLSSSAFSEMATCFAGECEFFF